MSDAACITRRRMLRLLAGGLGLALLPPLPPPLLPRPAPTRRCLLAGTTLLLEEDLKLLGEDRPRARERFL